MTIVTLFVVLAAASSASLPGGAPIAPENPYGLSALPSIPSGGAAFCPNPVPGPKPGTFT